MTVGDPVPPIELLRRAQEKDEAAISLLLQRVYGAVEKRVRKVLGKDSSCVDVIAWDAMTDAIGYLNKCNATTDEQLFAWFLKIAKNAALQERRRVAAVQDALHESPAVQRVRRFPPRLRMESLEVLKSVSGRLEQPLRQVLSMRLDQELSWSEIGSALGINPDAARKRFDRGLIRLREESVAALVERAAERGENVQALKDYLARETPTTFFSG